ncbi:unnamed protein product, partial [marine sediment metagenome]
SGVEISIKDLADKIANLMSIKIEIREEDIRKRPKKSEVERLVCNSDKMKRLTGWMPKYSLDKGLKETIKWFRENLHLYKSGVYNV